MISFKSCPGYYNILKPCLQCLNENLLVSNYTDQKQLLNKRSKLTANCRP